MKTIGLKVYQDKDSYQCRHEEITLNAIQNGHLLLKTNYSSLNYKDALAVTGKGRILKSSPLTPGIDTSGQIIESQSKLYTKGQDIIATGCGIGETFDGGYSSHVILNETQCIPLPAKLTSKEAMVYGTAGFTAALAVLRLQQNGQLPDMGPILVSGASGGVGSFSVWFLNALGFEVWALTSKVEQHARLKSLGANQCINTKSWAGNCKALESVKIGGGIDNLGGEFLHRMLASCQLWGSIASIGLASNLSLKTTVMPFILRGVSLLGVSSNNCTRPLRLECWKLIESLHDSVKLNQTLHQEIELKDVQDFSEKMIENKTTGRILVKTH